MRRYGNPQNRHPICGIPNLRLHSIVKPCTPVPPCQICQPVPCPSPPIVHDSGSILYTQDKQKVSFSSELSCSSYIHSTIPTRSHLFLFKVTEAVVPFRVNAIFQSLPNSSHQGSISFGWRLWDLRNKRVLIQKIETLPSGSHVLQISTDPLSLIQDDHLNGFAEIEFQTWTTSSNHSIVCSYGELVEV